MLDSSTLSDIQVPHGDAIDRESPAAAQALRRHPGLDELVRTSTIGDFSDIAASVATRVVARVREILAQSTSDRLSDAVSSLSRSELRQIEVEVAQAFQDKKMGVRELVSLARREISISCIRKSVPKYGKSHAVIGLEPDEYFRRAYQPYFELCEISGSTISTIDPNLHVALKRAGTFANIIRSLQP